MISLKKLERTANAWIDASASTLTPIRKFAARSDFREAASAGTVLKLVAAIREMAGELRAWEENDEHEHGSMKTVSVAEVLAEVGLTDEEET